MEDVLGRSTKVLVDVKGGNNMMYLPLDKIMGHSGSGNQITLPSKNDINELRKTLGQSRNSSVNSGGDRFSQDRFNNGR
jgi:membrane protease subunit HflK